MAQRILIVGGQGRIGSAVASDLLAHTDAEITITGRTAAAGVPFSHARGERVHFRTLELADSAAVFDAVGEADLVVHCAGPFAYRTPDVLSACIARGVAYVDVSDDRRFTREALALCDEAARAGITAVVNTGIFPGLSNAMVREGVEQFDDPEEIRLGYIVQGSGGAGITVMRTTFLALQHPFEAWIDGRWQSVAPYSDPEPLEIAGRRVNTYWFDMPESYTLARNFPVRSVVTKFGVDPDFYNGLTWVAAHWFPKDWLRNSTLVEFLSQVSHTMTDFTDRFSGIGVSMRAEVRGRKDGRPGHFLSTLHHPNTTVACGLGTGGIAGLILAGALERPGVWTVEQILPTELFHKLEASRGLCVQRRLEWS